MKVGDKVRVKLGAHKGKEGKILAKKSLAAGFRVIKVNAKETIEVHEGILEPADK